MLGLEPGTAAGDGHDLLAIDLGGGEDAEQLCRWLLTAIGDDAESESESESAPDIGFLSLWDGRLAADLGGPASVIWIGARDVAAAWRWFGSAEQRERLQSAADGLGQHVEVVDPGDYGGRQVLRLDFDKLDRPASSCHVTALDDALVCTLDRGFADPTAVHALIDAAAAGELPRWKMRPGELLRLQGVPHGGSRLAFQLSLRREPGALVVEFEARSGS